MKRKLLFSGIALGLTLIGTTSFARELIGVGYGFDKPTAIREAINNTKAYLSDGENIVEYRVDGCLDSGHYSGARWTCNVTVYTDR